MTTGSAADLDLPLPGSAGIGPPDPLSCSWDSTALLDYHGTGGKPVTGYMPPEPIEELCWKAHYRIRRLLGSGAQGVVYLARREGIDGYYTDVALKIFHRRPEARFEEYDAEMRRIALQAQRVSRIQHDNLINIRDFVAVGGERVMVLEWIDGLDVGRLLDLKRFLDLRRRLPAKQWEHLNDVIATAGEDHCRLKPGIAVDILRGCLAGLSALHHQDIVHCDLKPSNIMIKRTGTKKIIDIDSSSVLNEEQRVLRGTPYYMAPEQLQRKPLHRRSDIASLGYMLIEMLTGRLLFRDARTPQELLQTKLALPDRLNSILPAEARRNTTLCGLVSKMVAPEPRDRFPDADAADLDRLGAASFHRELVKTNLSTEYHRELAWWLELLTSLPEAS